MAYSKNLITTLADKNFLNYAKQLFSSIYWNAGWKGDYLLLSHEIPESELEWFREKGIYVKECTPLYDKNVGYQHFPPVVLDLFYLFTTEFKKWDNIIFLDADIIVRASLDSLVNVKGLASPCVMNDRLFMYFNQKLDLEEYHLLSKKYDLNIKPFNSGIMAFSTDIIHENTFEELLRLFYLYEKIGSGNDPVLNLFFYKNWKKLPVVYDITPLNIQAHTGLDANKLKGIIIHLKDDELQNSGLTYRKEWTDNLSRAENINLSIPQNSKKWSNYNVRFYSFYLHWTFFGKKITNTISKINIKRILRNIYHSVDRMIGKFGYFIKKISPRVYCFLRKILKKDKQL